jgi:DNA-binding sugar fermentation-stimulating protein|tara:strand:- start:7741 stop:8145 length:405 start_codon:yes stop_codon:yes gene_type:complete
MDVNSAFANPEVEKEGAWVRYRDGSKIKIARIGNANYTRSYDAKFKAHRRKQRAGTLETEVEQRLLCEVVAKTILLDWQGFTQNGKEFKYTEKRAMDLLESNIDFRNEVVELAVEEENFHSELLQESEKNLPGS